MFVLGHIIIILYFFGGIFVRFSEIQQKEVVNVCDGARLGFVCDMEIDIRTGCVKKIIIPASEKFLGVFGKQTEYHIDWGNIKCIGDDIILVSVNIENILIDC